MPPSLHKNSHTYYRGERETTATGHATREKRELCVREAPNGFLGIIRHPYATIEPSDTCNENKHNRKPEKRVTGNGRRNAEAGVMQRLVHAARWLEDSPGQRKDRKPDDSPRRPCIVAKREKEQRRNRQQGKVRRQAVLGYGLLHFSTSGAYRPCRGSGRNRSCARGRYRHRTCRSGTQACRKPGGSG